MLELVVLVVRVFVGGLGVFSLAAAAYFTTGAYKITKEYKDRTSDHFEIWVFIFCLFGFWLAFGMALLFFSLATVI